MSEVVIGEAVVLDLRPARLPSRALAFAIDALIMVTLLVGLLLLVGLAGAQFDDALSAAVSIVIVVGVFVGHPLLWESLTRGRSPGKFALGLRVVRDDGGPIGFRHALTRALAGLIVDFGVLSAFTGFFGVLTSLASDRGKRLGDLLAGTVVLRERVPRTASRPGELPEVHPQLAAWATGLELSRVPDDLALSARQFLARAGHLDPAVRTSLGERLATEIAGRVAPPPPAGVPAEVYLAAVLGERRRRETQRLGAAASSRPGSPYGAPLSGSQPSPYGAPPSGSQPSPYAPSGSQRSPYAAPPAGEQGPPPAAPAPDLGRSPSGAGSDGFAPPG